MRVKLCLTCTVESDTCQSQSLSIAPQHSCMLVRSTQIQFKLLRETSLPIMCKTGREQLSSCDLMLGVSSILGTTGSMHLSNSLIGFYWGLFPAVKRDGQSQCRLSNLLGAGCMYMRTSIMEKSNCLVNRLW